MTEATVPVIQTNPPKREVRTRELTRKEKFRIALPIVLKAVGKILLIPAVIIAYIFAVLVGVLVGEVFTAIGKGK